MWCESATDAVGEASECCGFEVSDTAEYLAAE